MPRPVLLALSDPLATDADLVGPKAANLAALSAAGLPTAGGVCIAATAYERQIAHLGLEQAVRDYADADPVQQRRLSVEVRLKLHQGEIAPDLEQAIGDAWHAGAKPLAVRSSALIEDRTESSFAGQFQSFLGISDKAEFMTALRACWAALWTTTARRAIAQQGMSPAATAMAVLVQPLVAAIASGGGLSETADGHILISATWGLGSAIAQGQIVPDRIVLTSSGLCAEHSKRAQAASGNLFTPYRPRDRGGCGWGCVEALSGGGAGGHARTAHAQGGKRAAHAGRNRMGA